MTPRNTYIVLALALTCLSGLSLCGCGTKSHVTPEEQANFKGGPPPPGFLAEAAKRKAAAEKRMPPSYKAWTEKRNATLGKKGAAPNSSATPPLRPQ